MAAKINTIPRDISWLSFNARVLQEANDSTVPLSSRIKFLGIHSNNQDEFYRVRVATLFRMQNIIKKNVKAAMHLEYAAGKILEDIQQIVLQQQNEFNRIWKGINQELKDQNIFIITENELSDTQKKFVEHYYDETVSPNLIPLMIESIPEMPYLRDKSIYLGVVMQKHASAYDKKFALIEIPVKGVGTRFVQLPAEDGKQYIMLLEDVIRHNLPHIFSFFGFDEYKSHVFKVTKDAEFDIDNDVSTTYAQKIEKGIKKRREGRPVRFIYDKEMDASLLAYLMGRLNLTWKDNIIPGSRIHNFRHFTDFPNIIPNSAPKKESYLHPDLDDGLRVTDVIFKKDVMLHFPYHSFNPIIDMLREAAIDPSVETIKITCYRLASNSKIVNALINAVRNGKSVSVFLELRARFDEEANLYWKEILEQEGVKVSTGLDNMKVHAKLCVIKKRVDTKKRVYYGFISTGNLNEKTARFYGDHCLLTSNVTTMNEANRIFNYLEKPQLGTAIFSKNKAIIPSPIYIRQTIINNILNEIKNAKAKKAAKIYLKVNSLSDDTIIQLLYKAAEAGVEIKLVVRGIFCAKFDKIKAPIAPYSVSIVDEYLEHARVMVFHNDGKPKVYISSADIMVRNLDHRVEAACLISNPAIKKEIIDMLNIEFTDNVKARILDSHLLNKYVPQNGNEIIQSQIEKYNYLAEKKLSSPVHDRFEEQYLPKIIDTKKNKSVPKKAVKKANPKVKAAAKIKNVIAIKKGKAITKNTK